MKKNLPTIYEQGFFVLNNWLKLKHSNKTLKCFFDDNYIKCVAIYGMGELGKRLYEELVQDGIEVKYAIDKNADNIEVKGLNIVKPEEELKMVGAVIVTPLHFFTEIEEMLYKKGMTNIISLEDVVVYCL